MSFELRVRSKKPEVRSKNWDSGFLAGKFMAIYIYIRFCYLTKVTQIVIVNLYSATQFCRAAKNF